MKQMVYTAVEVIHVERTLAVTYDLDDATEALERNWHHMSPEERLQYRREFFIRGIQVETEPLEPPHEALERFLTICDVAPTDYYEEWIGD